MSSELLISVSPGEIWAAFVEDDELTALRVFRTVQRATVGEIFLGRIAALRPDLPAALVDIGLDRLAFLSAEDAVAGTGIRDLNEGQVVIVQVVKEARADKAAGVSMRPHLAGRHVNLFPTRARDDWAKHADAATSAPEDIAADLDSLRKRWQAIEARARESVPPARLEASASPVTLALGIAKSRSPDLIVIDDRVAFAEARGWLARHRPALSDRLEPHRSRTPLFEERGIAGHIAAALSPRVALPGGGALTIEPSFAATLIDVDSGSGERRGKDAAAAALAVNLAAARMVARHIPLRNLAGPIVIDFIGMRSREQRERVRNALTTALGGEADTQILGWTRLGHLELMRKRREAPLAELLFEREPGGGLRKTPVTVALEALRAVLRETEATPGRAPHLHLHPQVAAALEGDIQEARRTLEARLGYAVTIVPEAGRPRDSFDIRLH